MATKILSLLSLLIFSLFSLQTITAQVASTQPLDCGVSGKQDLNLVATFPASTPQQSTFDVIVGGDSKKPVVVSGSSIKNIAWYFVVPTGFSVVTSPVIASVAPQGTVISGTGTLGTVAVNISGSVITMTSTGTINDLSSFVPPAFKITLKATGSAESIGKFVSQPSPAYTFNAVLNVMCVVTDFTNNWATIKIQSPPPPTVGPFAVASTRYDVPAMDQTNQAVWVIHPVSSDPNARFPLISYLHGAAGGNQDLYGYKDFFEQTASYGFIIVATFSCTSGCRDASLGARWSCMGVPQLEAKTWSLYYGEAIKMIDWAHNMTEAGDPLFTPIDWEAGVGVAGHSMGGQSTTVVAGLGCTKQWNIKAAALHHPYEGANPAGKIGTNISIPTIGFTSSGDSTCGRDCVSIMKDDTVRPSALRNVEGWSHLEPVLRPYPDGSENPYLATFTAAWFKVFLNGDAGEYYNYIFSDNTNSLCNHAPMVEGECFVTA